MLDKASGLGFPGGLDSEESVCNAGDQVKSLGQKDVLEKGMATNSGILVMENPLDRGAYWATVHGVTESDTPKYMHRVSLLQDKAGVRLTFQFFSFRARTIHTKPLLDPHRCLAKDLITSRHKVIDAKFDHIGKYHS